MSSAKRQGCRDVWNAHMCSGASFSTHDIPFCPTTATELPCEIITPDFSTYQDFPEPLKLYNTYRMRAFGYWLGQNGIAVINNVRWGTPETWWFCFDGIPADSIVAIGTVGGSPKLLKIAIALNVVSIK